jgi:hypothetical protein
MRGWFNHRKHRFPRGKPFGGIAYISIKEFEGKDEGIYNKESPAFHQDGMTLQKWKDFVTKTG